MIGAVLFKAISFGVLRDCFFQPFHYTRLKVAWR